MSRHALLIRMVGVPKVSSACLKRVAAASGFERSNSQLSTRTPYCLSSLVMCWVSLVGVLGNICLSYSFQ